MQHTLASPPPECADSGTNPSFNVLIAYEDFETGKHAKRTYDFLVDTLGRDCQFTNQMWKFDVLGIPKLREIAAADAADADIVVISCHGDEVPKNIKCWIESWIDVSDPPLALVALFDRPAEAAATRDYLAGVARRGGMDFFAQPDEWPGNGTDRAAREHEDLNRRALSTLADAVKLEPTVRRWSFGD